MKPPAAVCALLLLAVRASAQPLPIVDAHIHYSAPDWAELPPKRALAILASGHVKRAFVSSTPDDGTLKLYQAAPAVVVPFLRPYRTREDMASWSRDPAVAAYVEQRLARGVTLADGLRQVRGWLAQLPPDVAEQIAYRNADRLLARD